MSNFGIQIFNQSGQVRMDTSTSTIRLTSRHLIPAKKLVMTESSFLSIPGFSPSTDRVVLIPNEAGEFVYDVGSSINWPFLPNIVPANGGVTLIWNGSNNYKRNPANYISCIAVVMRKI